MNLNPLISVGPQPELINFMDWMYEIMGQLFTGLVNLAL